MSDGTLPALARGNKKIIYNDSQKSNNFQNQSKKLLFWFLLEKQLSFKDCNIHSTAVDASLLCWYVFTELTTGRACRETDSSFSLFAIHSFLYVVI